MVEKKTMSKQDTLASCRPSDGKAPSEHASMDRPSPSPAEPDDAKACSAPGIETTHRRGFVASLVGFFFASPLAVGLGTLAVTHFLWLLGMVRFMFPNILIEPAMRLKVGVPQELSPGQVETKYSAQHGVWIVRHEYEGRRQIFALKAVCTHLGCIPIWLDVEQKFRCPCHGSGFYKNGINFEGPAPRPLERFAIRIADDGQLEVDKRRTFRQELGQWQDPASFVPV